MIKSEKFLKLKTKLKKILHCIPVFNDTYVVLAIIGKGV